MVDHFDSEASSGLQRVRSIIDVFPVRMSR